MNRRAFVRGLFAGAMLAVAPVLRVPTQPYRALVEFDANLILRIFGVKPPVVGITTVLDLTNPTEGTQCESS